MQIPNQVTIKGISLIYTALSMLVLMFSSQSSNFTQAHFFMLAPTLLLTNALSIELLPHVIIELLYYT